MGGSLGAADGMRHRQARGIDPLCHTLLLQGKVSFVYTLQDEPECGMLSWVLETQETPGHHLDLFNQIIEDLVLRKC